MTVDEKTFNMEIGDNVDIFFDFGRLSGQISGKSAANQEWLITTWFHDGDIQMHDDFVYPEGGFQEYANTFNPGQVVSYHNGQEVFVTVIIHNIDILFGDEKYKVPVAIGNDQRIFFTPLNLKKIKKII